MDKNYVHVGNIIEQERVRRQAQISKGIDSEVYDHIEKAHNDDLNDHIEKSDNLTRFETDIQDLNKAETELLLHKIQRQLNADSESTLLKAMKSIAINHYNDIEKAKSGVYADTAENRKLGRVGQQYGGKKEVESMVNSEGMLNKKHPDAKRFSELDKKFDDKTTRKQMSDKELLEYDTLHRKFLSARKEWDAKRFSDSKKKIGGAVKSMSISDAVNKFLTEKENADYNEAISWGDDDDVKELEELAIKRAKKKGITINNHNGIEKAGHGIYEDNAENRRLNRVGQEYGRAAQQKEPTNKQPKKQEEAGGGLQAHAAKASDEALKRAAADEKADKSVREAAKAELAKRNGDSNSESMLDEEGRLNNNHPDAQRFTELDKKWDNKETRGQMTSDEMSELIELQKKFFNAQDEFFDKQHANSERKIGSNSSDNSESNNSESEGVKDIVLNKEGIEKLFEDDDVKANAYSYFVYEDDSDCSDEEKEQFKKLKKMGARVSDYFDWKEDDEAESYKDKMEAKGYRLFDISTGDGYFWLMVKNKKLEKDK